MDTIGLGPEYVDARYSGFSPEQTGQLVVRLKTLTFDARGFPLLRPMTGLEISVQEADGAKASYVLFPENAADLAGAILEMARRAREEYKNTGDGTRNG